MRDLQYGLAWGLIYAAVAFLTDIPAWKLVVAGLCMAAAFAVLIDWILWRVRGGQ